MYTFDLDVLGVLSCVKMFMMFPGVGVSSFRDVYDAYKTKQCESALHKKTCKGYAVINRYPNIRSVI